MQLSQKNTPKKCPKVAKNANVKKSVAKISFFLQKNRLTFAAELEQQLLAKSAGVYKFTYIRKICTRVYIFTKRAASTGVFFSATVSNIMIIKIKSSRFLTNTLIHKTICNPTAIARAE
jgi:hypothetical protein